MPEPSFAPQNQVFAWLKSHERAMLILAVLLQITVLVAMIVFRVILHTTGETVLLRVTPVDPRDIFRGDYVTLSYDFSRFPPGGIPGLGDVKYDYDKEREWQGRTVYIELLPEADGVHWRAGAFSLTPPSEGKYIRGTINSWQRIDCGIESYYVQEGEGMKYEQAVRDRKLSAEVSLASNGEAGLRALHIDAEPGSPATAETPKRPKPTWPSETTYRVRYLPDANIQIDGKGDDPAWAKANVEKQFTFPWKKDAVAPLTEFRALCDQKYFYFLFQVEDADMVVLDTLRDKEDVIFEDRAEMFFSRDPAMNEYYCFEIDPRGRAYDYSAKFYRDCNRSWSCPGLETKGTQTADGYIVEGRIPLESFDKLGFPAFRPGAKILCGLYRAEFSHDRSGKPVVQEENVHNRGRTIEGPQPIMEWMSWIDPKMAEPDFHVPGSLGWLEIVE